MGKLRKSLNDVNSNAHELLSTVQVLRTTRKNKPSEIGDVLKKLQKVARQTKASVKSFSSSFRNFLIGDIDQSIQKLEQSNVDLQDAHKHFDISKMEKCLKAMESLEETLPDMLTNLNATLDIFEHHPKLKQEQRESSQVASTSQASTSVEAHSPSDNSSPHTTENISAQKIEATQDLFSSEDEEAVQEILSQETGLTQTEVTQAEETEVIPPTEETQ